MQASTGSGCGRLLAVTKRGNCRPLILRKQVPQGFKNQEIINIAFRPAADEYFSPFPLRCPLDISVPSQVPPLPRNAAMSAANVRSLLRNERKARRIEHPHATYTAAGILSCQLCHIQIKAESLWNQHLRGSHHRGQLQRFRAAQASRAVAVANSEADATEAQTLDEVPPPANTHVPSMAVDASAGNKRKRKASEDEDIPTEPDDGRKKSKAPRAEVVLRSEAEPPAGVTEARDAVDEAEWAAFEREIEAEKRLQAAAVAPLAALTASAVISAAPMTAAEVAARSREEESRQAREKRQAEMEDEQEEAADRMVEEIEEQEELHERVNKWKEKREALRRKAQEEERQEAKDVLVDGVPEARAGEQSEDSADEEDEFDEWGGFRD